MKFYLHVRNLDEVRVRFAAAGLWARDPDDTQDPESCWHDLPATRALTAEERETDHLMRETPILTEVSV